MSVGPSLSSLERRSFRFIGIARQSRGAEGEFTIFDLPPEWGLRPLRCATRVFDFAPAIDDWLHGRLRRCGRLEIRLGLHLGRCSWLQMSLAARFSRSAKITNIQFGIISKTLRIIAVSPFFLPAFVLIIESALDGFAVGALKTTR